MLVYSVPSQHYMWDQQGSQNGFLYGAFVGALYWPQSVFANGFLMGPIWFINKGHIWAPYGAFIVK